LDEKRHPSERYCVGDVGGERRGGAALRRRYAAVFRDVLENPRSIVEALETDTLWPEYREALSFLDPEFEWKTVFLGETHRGYLETAKVWDDYLRWAADYRVDLQEAEDLGGDQVYAVISLVGTAKTGGAPIEAQFFDVFTLRNGRIVRLEEYTDRDKALEAADVSK
jgi:ketosteroid isomerase-like protein